MSYRGYSRHLCSTGHYLQLDYTEGLPLRCEKCGEMWAWSEYLDTTNSWEEDMETPLRVKECIKCHECGQTKELLYEIPKKYWRGKEMPSEYVEAFAELDERLKEMERVAVMLEDAGSRRVK